MQFFTAATLVMIAAFQATVQAAPLQAGIQARAPINDCGASTFSSKTAPTGSPFVSDCQAIANTLAGLDRSFTLSKIIPLDGDDVDAAPLTSGTCQFRLTTSNFLLAKVGNQDVVDLITASIAMFSGINSDGNPVVAASGSLGCESVGSTSSAKVNWSLGLPEGPSK